MATNFPTSLDTLTNPSAGDPTTNPSHALQHANANDAIEALEAKVGINGSAVTTSLDYRMGLQFIKSQVVGTSVASVTVSDAFSSTYDNYLVTITGGSASTGNNIQLKLGASTTAYSGSLIYVTYTVGTIATAADNNAAQFSFVGSGNTTGLQFVATILGPNLAKYTTLGAPYMAELSAGTYSGIHKASTQHTAFTILPSAGTLTGGTIRVYGYRN